MQVCMHTCLCVIRHACMQASYTYMHRMHIPPAGGTQARDGGLAPDSGTSRYEYVTLYIYPAADELCALSVCSSYVSP